MPKNKQHYCQSGPLYSVFINILYQLHIGYCSCSITGTYQTQICQQGISKSIDFWSLQHGYTHQPQQLTVTSGLALSHCCSYSASIICDWSLGIRNTAAWSTCSIFTLQTLNRRLHPCVCINSPVAQNDACLKKKQFKILLDKIIGLDEIWSQVS